MTDILNVPIFLTHFPVEIKAFYMRKDESDRRVTESMDVLMPGRWRNPRRQYEDGGLQ